MMRKKLMKIGAIAAATVLVFSTFEAHTSKVKATADENVVKQVSTDDTMVSDAFYYKDYLKQMKEKSSASNNKDVKEIVINGADFSSYDMEGLKVRDTSVMTQAHGSVSYTADVPKSGFYQIEVKYYPTHGSGASIIRNLYMNNELLFDECQGLVFQRLWADETKDYMMNTSSNQAAPAQIEQPEWTTKKLEASNGYYVGPLSFYLEKGKNTFTFESSKEPMEIGHIKLIPAIELDDYTAYLEKVKTKGVQIVSKDEIEGGLVTIQAEDAYVKSTASLIPTNDRTSVLTQPYHASNVVMNTIGGDNWSTPGDVITWKIDVPKTGLYKIATRFKQVSNRDFYSIRELRVNGEVPFREASQIKFHYDSKFQHVYLGNGAEDYYFYLQEGTNEVSLSVSLGDLGYPLSEIQMSVKNFNNLYRRLVAIMGNNPDVYRDYKITTSVKDMVDILQIEKARLNDVMNFFGDTIEGGGSKTTEISTMLRQVNKLIKKPDSIAKELSKFSTNISALSNWTMSLGQQPLLLDTISVCGDGYKLGKAEGNFFQNLVHKVKAFIGSFTNDYSAKTKEKTKKEKTIEVWITTSRDQYQVVQRLVNARYKDSPVNVVLKMVSANTILPSTLTGNGPDVAIQINNSMPTNFAFRGAAYDLTNFEEFNEVKSWFSDASLEFFEYQDGYYGLPDQMSFPVMFYRKDILKEMNLEIPNTWEELLALIPYLQSSNLDIYFESGGAPTLGAANTTVTKQLNNVFVSLLYQNGIDLYKNKGESTNLGSDEALQVFKTWSEYYTKHSFEVSMDFLTRFRTGEVPIAIVDFTNYNTLMASAPEIQGDWAIAPIPGLEKEDKTIDRSTASNVGASMIIKNTVERKGTQQEAWEFLKWWVSAKTQVEYANGLESVLGAAARYPVANLEALETLSWDAKDLEVLKETVSWMRGVPQVPGGYIMGRYVESAFFSVINENENPIDTLYNYIKQINDELTSKRKEFGLIE